MKNLLLSIILTSSTFVFAQNNFSEVVTSDFTQKELFNKSKDWIVKNFGDYKSVLQFEDPENNKIVIKGNSKIFDDILYSYHYGDRSNIKYMITIETKDNKYKYTIDNISFTRDMDFRNVGSNLLLSPQSLEHQIGIIEDLKSKINNNKNIIATTDKKSDARLLERENNKLQDELNQQTYLVDLEIKTLNNLIHSLKNTLNTNNDW